MSTTMACLKGKMGNTTYYQGKMPVRELVSSVRAASELDKWASMGVAERIQRIPDIKRIKNEIAPYYAGTRDRFFSSLVVLIYEAEVDYESLDSIVSGLPNAYKNPAKDIGFLTISGGSLVALDGQHRLKALEQVFKHEVSGEYVNEVPNDEVSVIFIDHEDVTKTRRIFNKLNRYAKSTGRGDNIITSEDDICAIIARQLMDEGAPLGVIFKDEQGKNDVIVNWKSNTLPPRSTKFTTISVLYDVAEMILKSKNKITDEKLDKQFRPNDEVIEENYELVESYWTHTLNGIDVYKEALQKPGEIPGMRKPESSHSLLFKPAAQLSLMEALLIAEARGVPIEDAIKRANKINWSMTAEIWQDIIIRSNGVIDPKAQARSNAAQLIAYLISADKMRPKAIKAVADMFNKERGNDDSPEDLPKPVID
ncbi:DGQHR domain-containing protein [Priestia megaterium]|uniref:DGQHR domain-containing protein n=1 Tax=Priestia megaterium TaxID=1404 RepID=UPI003008FC1E